MSPPGEAQLSGRRAARLTARLLRPRLALLAGVTACTTLVAATTVALAAIAGPAAASFYGASAPSPLRALSSSLVDVFGAAAGVALVMGALGVVRGLASQGRSLLLARLEEAVVSDLRLDLHARVLAAEVGALGRVSTDELGGRLGYEVDGVRMLLRWGVAGAIHNAVVVAALGALLLRLDPVLAAAGAVCLPAVAWVTARLGRRSRRAGLRATEAQADLAVTATEHAQLLPLARAFSAEGVLTARYRERVRAAAEHTLHAARLEARMGPWVQAMGALMGALLLFVAFARSGGHGRDAATDVSVLAALALLYGPARSLATTVHGLVAGLSHVDRMTELLALPQAPHRDERGDAKPSFESLALEGVSFAYGERPVLDDVTLVVKRGEAVALVGNNGAGKSTLLMLLGGLLRPTRGRAFLDGRDLADPASADARSAFAWVPAEPLLMGGTVLDNVAFGDPRPDLDRARTAAERAGALAFVESLPGGFAAPVTPGGRGFSSGERQRLCLARALYRDAAILLLDEPTASLDAHAAEAVTLTLESLLGDKTVVFTSHREPLVRAADRIIELRDGRLVEASESPRARLRRVR